MKKFIIFLITVLIILIGGVLGYSFIMNSQGTLPTFANKEPSDTRYIIKKSGKTVKEVKTKEVAIEKAKELGRSIVIDKKTKEWVYSTLSPFLIITDTAIHDFENFETAFSYAKNNDHDKIYYNNDESPIWEKNATLKEEVKMDVPLILQLPELPRGCEVTSLAMLLKYHNKNINKMELAEKVKKDETPYRVGENGRIFYGNPYDGFVGDMYNASNNGYGVYHGPITELGKEYVGDRIVDITGTTFEDVLYFVSNKHPVWVITNVTYKPLEEGYFKIWHTPTGIVKVTQKLHSVVITGYDKQSIYINDPFNKNPNVKVNKELFKKAWEQMGNQAVTILK